MQQMKGQGGVLGENGGTQGSRRLDGMGRGVTTHAKGEQQGPRSLERGIALFLLDY